MSKFEQIIANGNRGHGHAREPGDSGIRCADGFTLSVIAGGGTYCTPRPTLCSHPLIEGPIEGPWLGMTTKSCDYAGPYDAVEVGFPSARPEPWDAWFGFFEDWGDTDPTQGVYGYVPVDLVRALIEAHGGEA